MSTPREGAQRQESPACSVSQLIPSTRRHDAGEELGIAALVTA
jgi:hypothetical protein